MTNDKYVQIGETIRGQCDECYKTGYSSDGMAWRNSRDVIREMSSPRRFWDIRNKSFWEGYINDFK